MVGNVLSISLQCSSSQPAFTPLDSLKEEEMIHKLRAIFFFSSAVDSHQTSTLTMEMGEYLMCIVMVGCTALTAILITVFLKTWLTVKLIRILQQFHQIKRCSAEELSGCFIFNFNTFDVETTSKLV